MFQKFSYSTFNAVRLKLTLEIDVHLSLKLVVLETVPSIKPTFTTGVIPIVTGQVSVYFTVHINPLNTFGNISSKRTRNTYLLLAVMHGFHNRPYS